MPRRFKAVLFDLDGTLLYTLEDIRNALNHALARRDLPQLDLPGVRIRVGNGLKQLARDALPVNTDFPADKRSVLAQQIYDDILAEYQRNPVGKSSPYPGIPELLENLLRQKLSLGVWSNKDDNLVQRIVAHHFPGLFSAVRGRVENLPPKPGAEGGRMLLSTLRVAPSSALYVGDSEVDAESARACEMPFAAVDWGYRDRTVLLQNAVPEENIFSSTQELETYISQDRSS